MYFGSAQGVVERVINVRYYYYYYYYVYVNIHDVSDFGAVGLCKADGDEDSDQGIPLLQTIPCVHHTGTRSVTHCTHCSDHASPHITQGLGQCTMYTPLIFTPHTGTRTVTQCTHCSDPSSPHVTQGLGR